MKYEIKQEDVSTLLKMIKDKEMYLKPNIESSEYDYGNLDTGEGDEIDNTQRSLIWNKSTNQNLIKTIMSDLFVPAIILLEKKNKNDNKFKYAIIDGKQRLNAIWMYFAGKFKYDGNDLDDLYHKNFNELSDENKERFNNFKIPVIYIYENDLERIKKVFESLNVNSTKLKPQEIRHAIYHNKITSTLNKMHSKAYREENYSGSLIGKIVNTKIFNDTKLFNRSIDEFIVKLIRLFLKGAILDDSKNELDMYYKEFNEREFFDNNRKSENYFFSTLEELVDFYIFIEEGIPKEIRKPVIIYILFYYAVIIKDDIVRINLKNRNDSVYNDYESLFIKLNNNQKFKDALRNQNQKTNREKLIEEFKKSF